MVRWLKIFMWMPDILNNTVNVYFGHMLWYRTEKCKICINLLVKKEASSVLVSWKLVGYA